MLLKDLRPQARAVLDTASNGLFTRLCAFYSVHLTVQTHLDGLSEGVMKLYITILQKNGHTDSAVCTLGGGAKMIGWEIFVQDRLESARARVAKIKDAVQTLH